MRYKHIIWDFDGTLFDTYPAMAAAFCEALARWGITEPESAVQAALKVSMGHAKQLYGRRYHLQDDFFEEYKRLRRGWEEKSARPFAGAEALCRAVCAAGGCNHLLTHRGASAEAMLEKFDLKECFTGLVTAQSGFARKPSPEAMLSLMRRYGFSPQEALMVGDRELDLLCAQNAGVAACWFGGQAPCPVARHTARTMAELAALLGLG